MEHPERQDPEAAARRGRPRNEAIDEAAIEAALDLLVEGGVRAVTVEAVARRAGTTPPAIYRRWQNSEELLWAAMRHVVLAAARRNEPGPPYSTDGLDFEMALRQAMRRCAEIFSDRRLVVSYLAVAAALQIEPSMKLGYDRFRGALNGPLTRVIQPAAEAAGLPAAAVLDLVLGAIIHKAAIEHAPLSGEVIDQMAELVAAGCRALAR
jgi:AcrR family transcriptional regulator